MIRDLTARVGRETIIAGVAGLIVGCVLGWMLLGWVVFPVSWTDADPYDLREQHKQVYLSMVADSYALNMDPALARERVAGFDEQEISQLLGTLIDEREAAGDPAGANRLRDLTGALGVSVEPAAPTPEATPQSRAARITSLARAFLPICGVVIVLLLIVVVIIIVVPRFLRGPVEAPPEVVSERLAPSEGAREAALGHFVTTYHFGDDGYDTSFNIETPEPEGEFYGACGVGFSEIMGEGSPDKIVAFELWLFDKTDLDNVQTVTKVLMSEFAYDNEVLRAKMKDRGEAVLAEKGKSIVIDAVGLKLNAEIIDFAYGTDPSLPPRSYFETLTTELVPAPIV